MAEIRVPNDELPKGVEFFKRYHALFDATGGNPHRDVGRKVTERVHAGARRKLGSMAVMYFAESSSARVQARRVSTLSCGLLLGLDISLATLTRPERKSFLKSILSELIADDMPQGQYSMDALEDQVDDEYRNLELSLRMPVFEEDEQREIFGVGLGWIATYREEFIEDLRRYGGVKIMNRLHRQEKKALKKELKDISALETITGADFDF